MSGDTKIKISYWLEKGLQATAILLFTIMSFVTARAINSFDAVETKLELYHDEVEKSIREQIKLEGKVNTLESGVNRNTKDIDKLSSLLSK